MAITVRMNDKEQEMLRKRRKCQVQNACQTMEDNSQQVQLQIATNTTFKLEGNATLVLQDMSLVNNGSFNQTLGRIN